MRVIGRRRVAWVVVLSLAMVLGGAYVARGSHNFSDVPTGASFHNAAEWLFNRGVTLGCVAGLYCPFDVVTRASMALFMNRLGIVLTPTSLTAVNLATGADIDTAPDLCQTAPYVPQYPQRAIIDARAVGIGGAASYVAGVFPTFSANGGPFSPAVGMIAALSVEVAGGWGSASAVGPADLTPGTSYVFAVDVDRRLGTGDPTTLACEILVRIVNRNPTTSPLGIPQRPGTSGSPLSPTRR